MSKALEEQRFTIHGSVFRDKPGSVKTTGFLHRVLPVSAQRSFRDGAFRAVSDGGVAVAAGVSAVFRPGLAARFLSAGRRREDHRYGGHSRQVIEVVHPVRDDDPARSAVGDDERPKLIVFVHGGAWGSGSTWMYRLMVDRLSHSHHPRLRSYSVASVGYRVHPDADTDGQVNDLAEAMRWISRNTGTMGFDRDPEVYLMGHSSGAHIGMLYLVQQAEKKGKTETEDAARANAPTGLPNMPGSGDHGSVDNIGDGDVIGEDVGRQLEVEGFIGLSGVYDVHRHYLYESWRIVHEAVRLCQHASDAGTSVVLIPPAREPDTAVLAPARDRAFFQSRGVHEVSPMKAANGGRLHTLFDYSHQCFLGTGSHRATRTWSRPPLATSSGPSQHQQQHQHPRAQPPAKGEEPSTCSPRDTQPRGDILMSGGGHRDGGSSSAGNGPVALGTGGGGVPEAGDRGRGLGRRLPRVLVMHGTSDATVPFSQTAAVAAALRALGVPTVVRFEQGGDHFGMVGQVMFGQGSLVETAISQFTSNQAKEDARKERQGHDHQGLPRHPQARL
ncbi:unnamed protein product [Ectocarpus sp. 12 AP-2014]